MDLFFEWSLTDRVLRVSENDFVRGWKWLMLNVKRCGLGDMIPLEARVRGPFPSAEGGDFPLVMVVWLLMKSGCECTV